MDACFLLAVDHREHVVLAHDEVLFVADLHLLPRVLPEEDGVTFM
jgi:hypothetical protein